MFLITTADQRFWKTDEPILFLGEWCKLFSQKHQWEVLSYEILPYHWDDRKRLYRDYQYFNSLYEKLLRELSDILNGIHHVDHSIRYWRIIIGPWLYYFIAIFYDRFLSITAAAESGNVTETYINTATTEKWIPYDFKEFSKWYWDDPFNHYLYSIIIEKLHPFQFQKREILNKNETEALIPEKPSYSIKALLKKITRSVLNTAADHYNKFVMISNYFSNSENTKLYLSLKQIPYIYPPENVLSEKRLPVNSKLREKIVFHKFDNEFERLLISFLKIQIPRLYIEGYKEAEYNSLKAFPKRPKVILNATAYESNEAFKFWSATYTERGCKLTGFQHGGHYGMGLWSVAENHETKIYNRFYSWGWRWDNHDTVKPMPAVSLNKFKNKISPLKNGRLLLIQAGIPRYFYQMISMHTSANGMLSYFKDQYKFIDTLSAENKKLILVRCYMHDYNWDQIKRWNQNYPFIECYQGNKSIIELFNESRLAISTYNATSYLETFTANFPTILFWDPYYWEIRPQAQQYFDNLKKVGIFHDTPESAAKKINEISKDTLSWWRQPEIQKEKDAFCRQFAITSENWLNLWKNELKTISSL
jgi:putative transferase (TIGR04331 family)